MSSGKASKSIISILSETNKEEIVNAASLIIASESKDLCKKHSGSILQKKDNDSILEFSWDMFHKELQLRAPNILQVIASAVCDVPVKVEDKKFAHILHSVASVLHGRSAEMSSLHYQIGFILAHGGCTQRVSVFLRKPKTYSLIKFRSSICSSFFLFFKLLHV